MAGPEGGNKLKANPSVIQIIQLARGALLPAAHRVATLQSGGPDSPAIQGHASPRCNRILKDWTAQSAQKIHLYGPPELKDSITR